MTDTAIDLPHLLTDAPASTDLLGFKPHAERLAALIQKQIPDKASFVIGIEGEWGEGKSSFINLLKDAFPAEKTDETRPTIVDFNPWWFEGSDQLLRHFFDELLGQIDRSGRWTAPARKFMRGLAGLLDGGGKAAQLIPDPSVMAAGKAAETASGLLHKLGVEKTRSAQVLKASSKHVLEAQQFKTIVFIDDLDRLPAREIVELFRVIKAVADLPNIIYVIAYDRAIVASALNEVHKGKGEAYLEKIVQLPYRLPKPTFERWNEFMVEHLLQIDCVQKVVQDESEDVRRGLLNIAAGFLSTPRDVKRLQSALILTEHVPGEIGLNPLDFVLLEAMRLKNRQLWQAVIDAWRNVVYYNLEYGRQHNDATMGGKNAEANTKLWLGVYFPAGKYRTEELVALQYFTNWPLIEPQPIGRVVQRRDDDSLLKMTSIWPEFSQTVSGREIQQLADNYLQYASAQEV